MRVAGCAGSLTLYVLARQAIKCTRWDSIARVRVGGPNSLRGDLDRRHWGVEGDRRASSRHTTDNRDFAPNMTHGDGAARAATLSYFTEQNIVGLLDESIGSPSR